MRSCVLRANRQVNRVALDFDQTLCLILINISDPSELCVASGSSISSRICFSSKTSFFPNSLIAPAIKMQSCKFKLSANYISPLDHQQRSLSPKKINYELSRPPDWASALCSRQEVEHNLRAKSSSWSMELIADNLTHVKCRVSEQHDWASHSNNLEGDKWSKDTSFCAYSVDTVLYHHASCKLASSVITMDTRDSSTRLVRRGANIMTVGDSCTDTIHCVLLFWSSFHSKWPPSIRNIQYES